MVEQFAAWPHAIAAAREVADACRFNLEELHYEYPKSSLPDDITPQDYLTRKTWEGLSASAALPPNLCARCCAR